MWVFSFISSVRFYVWSVLIKFVCFSGLKNEDKMAEIWSVDGKLQQRLFIRLPEYDKIRSMAWNKRDTSIAVRLLYGNDDQILITWDLGRDCITGRTKIKFHFVDYCWKDEYTLLILTHERKAGGRTYSIYSRMANDTSNDLFKSPPVMVFDWNEWSIRYLDLKVST